MHHRPFATRVEAEAAIREYIERSFTIASTATHGLATWHRLSSPSPTGGQSLEAEVFYVLCLDGQCRVLYPALIGEGTVK